MDKVTYHCTLPVLCSVLVSYGGPPGLNEEQVFEAISEGVSLDITVASQAGLQVSPVLHQTEFVFRVVEGYVVTVECSEFTIDEIE